MAALGCVIASTLVSTLAMQPSVAATVPPNAQDNLPTQSAKEPVTVAVPVRTITTPGTSGQSGIIDIRVGESGPLAVMLDTGSVGLRLWSGAQPGMTLTKKKMTSVTGGESIPGLRATAPMSIGGVTTTVDVPVQLINTSSAYISSWKARGISGILGIGTGTGGLTNPLMSLPGDLGLRWSVRFTRNAADTSGRVGALTLGALPPTNADMHFTLPYVGVNANGALLWDDHAADGCWTFNGGREYCVPTWFDSGFTVMRIKGKEFARLPITSNRELKRGTRVSLAAESSAFVADTFTAGTLASENLVRVMPRGSATINTGNSFYFEYTVTYNVLTGDLYLSKPPRKRK